MSLLPCPYCGTSHKVRVDTARFIVLGDYEATACCEHCGKFTAAHTALTEAAAIELATVDWNTRTSPRTAPNAQDHRADAQKESHDK